jgi:uncharacterized protein YgfB (UPF0149 family)
MRKRKPKKTSAIRKQAFQIALQLPENKSDADAVLSTARSLHEWMNGTSRLPKAS